MWNNQDGAKSRNKSQQKTDQRKWLLLKAEEWPNQNRIPESKRMQSPSSTKAREPLVSYETSTTKMLMRSPKGWAKPKRLELGSLWVYSSEHSWSLLQTSMKWPNSCNSTSSILPALSDERKTSTLATAKQELLTQRFCRRTYFRRLKFQY